MQMAYEYKRDGKEEQLAEDLDCDPEYADWLMDADPDLYDEWIRAGCKREFFIP
jgi:hypothetical protein